MVLHIPVKIWQQITYYADQSAPNEVTGIGTIITQDPNNLLVTEIFLPNQQITPATSDFTEDALNNIIHHLLQTGPNRVSDLRFRWHSHGLHKVFWSQKDQDDIESWESSWVVNLVVNTQHQYLARYDSFTPHRVCDYEMVVCIDYPEDTRLWAQCQAELKQKAVTRRIPGILRKEP